jgi:hypothetical protein
MRICMCILHAYIYSLQARFGRFLFACRDEHGLPYLMFFLFLAVRMSLVYRSSIAGRTDTCVLNPSLILFFVSCTENMSLPRLLEECMAWLRGAENLLAVLNFECMAPVSALVRCPEFAFRADGEGGAGSKFLLDLWVDDSSSRSLHWGNDFFGFTPDPPML